MKKVLKVGACSRPTYSSKRRKISDAAVPLKKLNKKPSLISFEKNWGQVMFILGH